MEMPRTTNHAALVRTAREDDLDRLVSIHSAAFPDARGREARRRNFAENVRGSLGDLFVAERDGALVGHAFLFRMSTWIGGVELPIGGIASVGVAPEWRGSGVGRGLIHALHDELRARGTGLSLLYPFRHSFYRRLGYGTVAEVKRLRVPPSALPGREVLGEVRGASPDDWLAMRRCYERLAARSTGLLARREAVWRAALSPEGRQIVVVAGARGELSGYAIYAYMSAPDGLAQELDVLELVAETDVARLALLGFFRRQRDQAPYVRLLLDARDPLALFCDEPRAPTTDTIRSLVAVAGELGAGAMLRIVDLRAALAARGYAADGELTLRIVDAELSLGATTGTLRVSGGRAVFGPERHGPRLTVDASTFAQIYAGAVSATDAARYGRAETSDAETLRLADRLFAVAPFFTLDTF